MCRKCCRGHGQHEVSWQEALPRQALRPLASGFEKGVPAIQCYCCATEMARAREVKLRVWHNGNPTWSPNSAAYLSYKEDMTYRWAVVCQACFQRLDNESGVAEIGGRLFNLAGASRGDKAAVLNEAKYQAFQRRQAAQWGLDP